MQYLETLNLSQGFLRVACSAGYAPVSVTSASGLILWPSLGAGFKLRMSWLPHPTSMRAWIRFRPGLFRPNGKQPFEIVPARLNNPACHTLEPIEISCLSVLGNSGPHEEAGSVIENLLK